MGKGAVKTTPLASVCRTLRSPSLPPPSAVFILQGSPPSHIGCSRFSETASALMNITVAFQAKETNQPAWKRRQPGTLTPFLSGPAEGQRLSWSCRLDGAFPSETLMPLLGPERLAGVSHRNSCQGKHQNRHLAGFRAHDGSFQRRLEEV